MIQARRAGGEARRKFLLAAFVALLGVLLLAAPRPRPAAAQAASSGVLAGVVLDQEDRQPLPNARVAVYASSPSDSGWTLVKDGLTDAAGAFRYSVPPGSYRLVFYSQSFSVGQREGVVVTAGATVEVTVTLTPRPIQIEGVQVKGEEARSSEATTLAKRKRADYVSDGISAEQIAKSSDSNAADALQRVTGLSVVGGRYVYVRGLGERYSSTQVNGASLGTPEPNKRVVPLDLFPSAALDNIVVQKSYTPDQDGEFAGGVIQLNTRDFVGSKTFTQSFSTGYSSGTLDRKRLAYAGGALDFVGFDDGTRDFPRLFGTMAQGKPIRSKGVFGGEGFTAAEIQALGRSFNKVWSPQRSGPRPNVSYAGTFGQRLELLGKEVGILGSLSFSNSITTQERDNNAYSGTPTHLTPLYRYRVEETTAKMLGGALANFGLRVADGHTVRLRALYTRTSEDNTRVMQGPNYNFGTDLVRISSLDFIERGLFSGVLSAEHTIAPLGGVRIDWKTSYSEAMRDEPDRRESVYESDGVGGIQLSGRRSLPLTRVFGDMNEYDRSASTDLSRSFHLFGDRELKVKAGGTIRQRNRVSAFRRLGFKLGLAGRDSLDLSLPPEELLVDENIRPGWFELQEATRENDSYRAKHYVRGAYGLVEIPLPARLELLAGAREEWSTEEVEARSPFVTTAPKTNVLLNETDALPMASLTWRLDQSMNARIGYSVTVSRPDLREMAPFDIYDYETGYSEIGNTSIHSTRIENYDFRWELYPGARELVSVSAFRKVLFQPIENVIEGSSGGYILSPRNGRDGRVYGIELEGRLSIAKIWNEAARRFSLVEGGPGLDRWAVSANYSRVESSVRVHTTTGPDGAPIYREGPLQGQSSYALNAGLYYGSEAMEGSLLLAAFGQRLAQVGAGAYPNSLPDIYEHLPVTLDLTASRQLGSGLRLKVAAENLLDRATEYRQLDDVTRRYRSGRTVSLSMSMKR